MKPDMLIQSVVPVLMAAAAACAQPDVYQRVVPLSPGFDTTEASWERHAVRVLEARGYNVTVEEGARHGIRAERQGGDSVRHTVRVRRSTEQYAAGAYLHRYAYAISALSTDAAGRRTNLGPDVARDVDTLVAEFEALRASGVPPWVGRLTCAVRRGIEREFYVSVGESAVKMGSQRVREHADYKGGLTVVADGAAGLQINTWPASGDEVTALRDAILQRCGGTIQPGPTEASAAG